MAIGDLLDTLGAELVLGATGTTTSISNGSIQECTDDDIQTANRGGYPFGIFEFDCAAGGFSAPPTVNATISLVGQKINSDTADEPDPTATYQDTILAVFPVPPSDAPHKFVSDPVFINPAGLKVWVLWNDGGAGTVSLDAAWALRYKPYTNTPATS